MCYQCNSEYDPRCGDPFDPYSLGMVNCSMKQHLEHLPGVEPSLCRKSTQKSIFPQSQIKRSSLTAHTLLTQSSSLTPQPDRQFRLSFRQDARGARLRVPAGRQQRRSVVPEALRHVRGADVLLFVHRRPVQRGATVHRPAGSLVADGLRRRRRGARTGRAIVIAHTQIKTTTTVTHKLSIHYSYYNYIIRGVIFSRELIRISLIACETIEPKNTKSERRGYS